MEEENGNQWFDTHDLAIAAFISMDQRLLRKLADLAEKEKIKVEATLEAKDGDRITFWAQPLGEIQEFTKEYLYRRQQLKEEIWELQRKKKEEVEV